MRKGSELMKEMRKNRREREPIGMNSTEPTNQGANVGVSGNNYPMRLDDLRRMGTDVANATGATAYNSSLAHTLQSGRGGNVVVQSPMMADIGNVTPKTNPWDSDDWNVKIENEEGDLDKFYPSRTNPKKWIREDSNGKLHTFDITSVPKVATAPAVVAFEKFADPKRLASYPKAIDYLNKYRLNYYGELEFPNGKKYDFSVDDFGQPHKGNVIADPAPVKYTDLPPVAQYVTARRIQEAVNNLLPGGFDKAWGEELGNYSADTANAILENVGGEAYKYDPVLFTELSQKYLKEQLDAANQQDLIFDGTKDKGFTEVPKREDIPKSVYDDKINAMYMLRGLVGSRRKKQIDEAIIRLANNIAKVITKAGTTTKDSNESSKSSQVSGEMTISSYQEQVKLAERRAAQDIARSRIFLDIQWGGTDEIETKDGKRMSVDDAWNEKVYWEALKEGKLTAAEEVLMHPVNLVATLQDIRSNNDTGLEEFVTNVGRAILHAHGYDDEKIEGQGLDSIIVASTPLLTAMGTSDIRMNINKNNSNSEAHTEVVENQQSTTQQAPPAPRNSPPPRGRNGGGDPPKYNIQSNIGTPLNADQYLDHMLHKSSGLTWDQFENDASTWNNGRLGTPDKMKEDAAKHGAEVSKYLKLLGEPTNDDKRRAVVMSMALNYFQQLGSVYGLSTDKKTGFNYFAQQIKKFLAYDPTSQAGKDLETQLDNIKKDNANSKAQDVNILRDLLQQWKGGGNNTYMHKSAKDMRGGNVPHVFKDLPLGTGAALEPLIVQLHSDFPNNFKGKDLVEKQISILQGIMNKISRKFN
jgi:hypothetical protein